MTRTPVVLAAFTFALGSAAFAQTPPPASSSTPNAGETLKNALPQGDGGGLKSGVSGEAKTSMGDSSATLSGRGEGKLGAYDRQKPLQGLKDSEVKAGGSLKTERPDGDGGTTKKTYGAAAEAKNGDFGVSVDTPRRDIDINTGSEQSLREQLGLSSSEAKALTDFRQKNGGIKNRQQLDQVKGLSKQSRDRIAERLNLAQR